MLSDEYPIRKQFSKKNSPRAMNDPESRPAPSASDWHPADVLAALKKRGKTLSGLSVDHGYHPTAAGKALKRPWPALEAIIAHALGREPAEIWPSRYPLGAQAQGRARR